MSKLWVDDIRDPPDETWTVARTSKEAILTLLTSPLFEVMSLDHDLGGDDTTRPILLWLCEHRAYWPREVRAHTANPVGRSYLTGMVDRYHPRNDPDHAARASS